MKDKAEWSRDYINQLSNATDQMIRIKENMVLRSVDVGEMFRVKSIILMSAVIRFSALRYFADNLTRAAAYSRKCQFCPT